MTFRRIQFLLAILIATLVHAQEYERRLIPLAALGTPGAFGTVWNTRVTAVAEGDLTELVGFIVTSVPPGVGSSQPQPLVVPRSVAEPPGTIAYIPAGASARVHLTAIVEERSGSHEEISIPIVRERAFTNETGYFLDLTRRPTRRLTLRVYSLDLTAADAQVRVRIQVNQPPYLRPWEFVYDQAHRLLALQRLMSDYQGTVSLPVRPLALEIGLDALLRDVPEGAELAVSVVPIGELRIWSMLSETDGVTQRVTLRHTD